MKEIGHIVETGTTPENTKETGHTLEINHTTEIGLIVDIGCETTTEMIIEMKAIQIRDIRAGVEIIMKMLMKTCIVGISINTSTEMTAVTNTEVHLEKDTPCLRKIKMTSQRLNKSTTSYDS